MPATSVTFKGEKQDHENRKVLNEPPKSISKISELLNRNDTKDNVEPLGKRDITGDSDGRKGGKIDGNDNVNHDENVNGKGDEKVEA